MPPRPLHNPLLEALFHAPSRPLRKITAELAAHPADYTVLVPPAPVLHGSDGSGGSFADVCASDDFVRSHVLHTAAALSTSTAPVTKTQSFIYNTLNGKQVLLKQGAVFTGKGFRKSVRLAVVHVAHLRAFGGDFATGCQIALVYVDGTLFGPQPAPPAGAAGPARFAGAPAAAAGPTFDALLRTYPPLSQAVAGRFYELFHHNNARYQRLRQRQRLALDAVAAEFHALAAAALDAVQTAVTGDSPDAARAASALDAVHHAHPALDVAVLVHEYTERRVHDRVWPQLVRQYTAAGAGDALDDPAHPKTVLTAALYRDLSCLSLNQLDLPVNEPWRLNALYRRVADAIHVFAQLAGGAVSTRSQKVRLVQDTVAVLTRSERGCAPVDADTLIGLLIMVVVHSKVPNLECHLYYMRHFGPRPRGKEDGYMSYILSNLDAVIYHLHEHAQRAADGAPADAASMSAGSARNYEFWLAIQQQNAAAVDRYLDECTAAYDAQELPKEHFLRSKNINGESCFHFAVRARNPDVFRALLHKTAQWFSLEDFFFDENTATRQSLLMVALQEGNPQITDDIIDVVAGATADEQRSYYNARDANGRTVGHYLAHDLSALGRVGPLVDWTAKDANSHTPLFSLCRSYDQPDYVALVAKAFSFVVARPGSFTLDEHTDKAGNTLLHALARGIPESGLLSNASVLVDVNQPNHKGLTPTALSIRYNRLENLESLLDDSATDFLMEDPRNLYTIMDYYSFSASKNVSGPRREFAHIEKAVVKAFFSEKYPRSDDVQIGTLNAKFDAAADDWVVNSAYFQHDPPLFSSKYIPMDKMRQFYRVHKTANPLGFMPSEAAFWANFPKGTLSIPACSKHRCNQALDQMSMFFASANFLHQSARKQLVRHFSRCCRDDSSVLDITREAHEARDAAMKKWTMSEMSHQTVQEIAYFIEFSQADLRKYKAAVSRLGRLAAFGSVKQCDMRSMLDRFLHSMGALRGCRLDYDIEFRSIDGTYATLQQYVTWIELCIDELAANCEKVLTKLRRWETVYGQICEVNSELRKFEDKVVVRTPDRSEASPQGNAGALSPETSEVSRPTSSEGAPADEASDAESSFFSFGLIDTKKSRYRKLLLAKSEDVKKLVDLNVEIRLDHETIASEISQFLQFRAAFLTFGIKQFTRRSLVSLRNRHLELSRTLAQIKTKSQ